MEFIEQYHVVNSLRDYFTNNINSATQEDALKYVHRKHRLSLSRRSFYRYLEIVQEIFSLKIEYNISEKVYKTFIREQLQ